MIKIKWKLLKKIIDKMSSKSLEIILSTTLDSNINAVTDGTNIMINGNNIKSIDQVIKSIAHELVHIIDNYNDGTDSFLLRWKIYEGIIKDKYF